MLSEKDAMHVSLPALVESMLLDKNADIDRLEKQVHHLSKQVGLLFCLLRTAHHCMHGATGCEFTILLDRLLRRLLWRPLLLPLL